MPDLVDKDSSHTVVRQINPWVTTLSVPFYRYGLIKVGGRGTLVKLDSGGVAVFSPTSYDDIAKEAVEKLGPVKYITAPDIEHHIHLGAWHKAYPDAHIIGVEGLPEKRLKQKNETVPFTTIFTKEKRGQTTVDATFDAEFEYEYVPESLNKELVFFHKPSKTMIQADLFFNLPAYEQYSKVPSVDATSGIFTKLFTACTNTQGDALGQKRFLWYAIISDKDTFAKSATRMNSWPIETIVPCHGDVLEGNGKSVFEKVFAWYLALDSKKK